MPTASEPRPVASAGLQRRLSFVFPVSLKERLGHLAQWRSVSDDVAEMRLKLLLRSFLHFFYREDLALFLLICPDDEVEHVAAWLHATTSDERFRVLPETALCPELGAADERTPGWYVQQCLKLAAHRLVPTSFYVTLDADVVCTRPFSYEALFSEGRVLLNTEGEAEYRALYTHGCAERELSIKQKRYAASAKLLGLKQVPEGRCRFYGETPVLLHTQSVGMVTQHLEERFSTPWAGLLLRLRGWTEYGLYFQFLEATGRLDALYCKRDCDAVLDLSRSVWQADGCYRDERVYDREHFFPPEDAGARQSGIFVAIQSWLKAEEWLPEHCRDVKAFYQEVDVFDTVQSGCSTKSS